MREHPLKGAFDVSSGRWVRPDTDDESAGELEIGFADNGLVAIRRAGDPDGTICIYTAEAWDAFVAGVHDGELDLAVLQEDERRTNQR